MTKYNQVTPEIAAQLQAIVGAKRFFAGDAVKDDFSHDEMPIYGKYYPEVVCEAESTEEVSAILRVCYDNNIPVTPRGAAAAYALNRELACFNPTRLATSPWVRCQETLEMFAWQTGRDMVHLDPLTEDAYAAAPDTAWECLLSEIEFALERRQPIAICMHRPVIGGMFGHLRSMCVAPSLSKRLIAKTPFMPTGTAVALFVTPTPHGPKIIDIQKVQPLVY